MRIKPSLLMGALVMLSLTAMAVQAVETPPELKGEPVKVQDILQNESIYHGRNVVIDGKIELECASGCWFIVNDGGASIFVDILPSNFVIPQKSGSDVRVYGEVTTKDGDTIIIGKIVQIGGEIYR